MQSMLAVALSLLSAIGLASTAVMSRIGMQGVHRVNAAGVSLVVGFLLTLLLAVAGVIAVALGGRL